MNNIKRVYTFGNGKAEGRADMRNELGGKGANLAEMNLIGVPVPPGFTITTDVCNEYYKIGKDQVVALLKEDVEKSLHQTEQLMNSKFGDVANPLLLSVRSGARASMPGMMDTILNLGLNDEIDDDFELELADKFAKKFVKTKKITDKADAQKVGAHLFQKGFDWRIINKVMANLFDVYED